MAHLQLMAVASGRDDEMEEVALLGSYDEEVAGEAEEASGMRRVQVRVTGMTCSACTIAVEAAVFARHGVRRASVSLLQSRTHVVFVPALAKADCSDTSIRNDRLRSLGNESIPATIGGESMKVLRLGKNSLTGEIPAQIGNCSALALLLIRGIDTGTIYISIMMSGPGVRLDIGEGKEVNLGKCPRSKLQSQCIKYLGPKERHDYEVVVESGRLVYKQTGVLLHTLDDSKWIFVLSATNPIYVGQKKKGSFQHSSFPAGGAITSAGRLVVKDGFLKECFEGPNNVWQLDEKDVVDYFTLQDLWGHYSESSAYGLGVPVRLETGKIVT